jgi:hypothetical protein
MRGLLKPVPLTALVLMAGAPAAGQGVRAVQEEDGSVRVVVPGRFETTITKKKGFGHTWFDLKHDPERKRDLAPILTEAGLLWTKLGVGEGNRVGTANPPRRVDLLEAGPVRVRARLTGAMNRRGLGIPEEDLPELGFEQTFTVYPNGAVYVDYVLVAQEDLTLRHFLLILKPNGAWGRNGKGEGAGEVRCAGEHGPAKPDGATASSFALEWTDGPTYFQDILMVLYRGRYKGTYWDEGYLDKDLRCGLDLLSRWPDRKVAKGRDPIRLMMCFRDDLNGSQAARPVAEDYRLPDRLTVVRGEVDPGDDGDGDGDGFNEAEGCHVLRSSGDGVAFTLHGASVPRHFPAFKVKGWTGAPPEAIALGGAKLAAGEGFTASAREGILLFQLQRVVRADVEVSILKP